MESKNDWKEIERYIDNRNTNKINNYKIDINKEYNKMVNKSRRKNKR